MSVTLNNKRILVTRPRHQAEHLCELILNSGGESILFPTIEIQPVIDSEKLSTQFQNTNEDDFILFVSRNAVKIAFDHYIEETDLTERIQFVAIGAGTADALADMNINNVLHAGIQADSETLLQLPELQAGQIRDKKILIVRGVGGRELLAGVLKARGASVDYAEVYTRSLPKYEMKDSHEIWNDIKPDAVIVSSNDGLNNLMNLISENDWQQLFSTRLVAMSTRTADLAKVLGFISEIGIAKDKNDEGLLSALLELVGD